MKLSEAIRLGAMSVPARRGPIVSFDESGHVCGACLIGTALFAAGAIRACDGAWSFVDGRPQRVFPILYVTGVQPPEPTCVFSDVFGIVVTLFENFHWTRERIADWVATIEAQHEQQDHQQPFIVE